jgi:hypothetical protein
MRPNLLKNMGVDLRLVKSFILKTLGNPEFKIYKKIEIASTVANIFAQIL